MVESRYLIEQKDKTVTSSAHITSKWMKPLYIGWFFMAFAVMVVLLGTVPEYYRYIIQVGHSGSYSLGQLNILFQFLVRLSDLFNGFVSFILAGLLLWRKPNDRMALFSSFFFLITAVTASYTLDYFLTAYFGLLSTYELYTSLHTPFWILLFCIFPDGLFVPCWTKWVFLLSIPLSLAGLVSKNLDSIAVFFTIPLFILIAYGQFYRYRRVSTPAERKQTKWVVYGIILSVLLSVIASIIYKTFSPPLINVFPVVITIAILRLHLWDIDILIRKTFIYGVVVVLLAILYFLGVVLLQQIFFVMTGPRTELLTVLSTLAITTLFNPLRRWVQALIDQRFYRRKYDAEQALAVFASQARADTDLERLSAGLLTTVGDALQPQSTQLWIVRRLGKTVDKQG